jgi:hypothetical protein
MTGTSRGNIILRDCHGTSGNEITLRNDTTESSAITLTGGSGFVMLLDDVTFFIVDGTGKWSGASANGCGAAYDGGDQNCGIRITTNTGCATALVKILDDVADLTIKGVEAFGYGYLDVCPRGIAFQLHDNNTTNTTHPGAYYENWTITENYIHESSRSSIYSGSNMFGSTAGARALTLRNHTYSYNLITNVGCDGLKIKSHKEGSTTVEHNIVRVTGLGPLGPSTGCNGHAYSSFESTGITYDSNWASDTGGLGAANCFNFLIDQATTSIDFASADNTYVNNVAVDCKGDGLQARNDGDASEPDVSALVFNNTFTDTTDGIDTAGADGTSTVQDNIACDNNTNIKTAAGDTANNNQTAACSTQDFVNLVGRDFHLASTGAPAYNTGGNYVSPPTTDFDDVVRPQAVTEDAGAFEFETAGAPAAPGSVLRRPHVTQ